MTIIAVPRYVVKIDYDTMIGKSVTLLIQTDNSPNQKVLYLMPRGISSNPIVKLCLLFN